jgi:hypothetical protein
MESAFGLKDALQDPDGVIYIRFLVMLFWKKLKNFERRG